MDTQVISRAFTALILVMPLGMAQAKPDASAGAAKPSFIAQSSRMLTGDAKMAWIIEMKLKLPISRRQIGPFGLAQDPSVQVVQKKQAKAKPGAFLNAVKAMKINTVMASEQKFAIGAREFHTGDKFPVIRGQRQFNIKIVSVRSDHIIFENVDTGENVRRNLNALPPGVSRSKGIESVPGVIPASKKDDSPLHLDSPTVPTSNRE